MGVGPTHSASKAVSSSFLRKIFMAQTSMQLDVQAMDRVRNVSLKQVVEDSQKADSMYFQFASEKKKKDN